MVRNDITVREKRIAEVFRSSNLEEKQFTDACKQIVYAQINDEEFNNLSVQDKERYLSERKIFGYRFLGDSLLVELFNTFNDIKLTEIYSVITARSISCNIDFSALVNNENKILIAGGEMFLNQLPKIITSKNHITIWVMDNYIYGLLKIDYANMPNVIVEQKDLYNSDNRDKYSLILSIPPFGLKRFIEKGKYYGNDSSTIATQILFENNLAENGKIITIMPNKVNFSQSECHFRQKYEGNLIEVVNLPNNAFNNTRVKTYLYKFTTQYSEKLLLTETIGVIGNEYNVKDIKNPDSTWDFDKPFKEVDEDMQSILSQPYSKLSDVSIVLRGKPLSKYAEETDKDEDFIYVDLKSLKENDIDYSEAKKYKIDDSSQLKYLQNGDLLIPNKGNSSKIVIFNDNDKKCIASANILVIRPNCNKITAEYLATYLRSSIGQKLIKNIQRGTAMSFINHVDLQGIAVVVPNLTQQNCIIEKYNNKKEGLKGQLKQIQKDIAQLEQNMNDIICGKIQDFE